MQVTVLHFDGCPNWETTYRQLETLSAELDATSVRHRGRQQDVTDAGLAGAPTEQQLREALASR